MARPGIGFFSSRFSCCRRRVRPEISAIALGGILLLPCHSGCAASASSSEPWVWWGPLADVLCERIVTALPEAPVEPASIRLLDPDPRIEYTVRPTPEGTLQPCLRWNDALPFPPVALSVPLRLEIRDPGLATPLRVEKEVRLAGRREGRWRIADSDPRPEGQHGRALAVEGDRLFIGSGDVVAGSAEYVSVYRLDRNLDVWEFEQVIGEPTDTDANGFGSVLAVASGILAAGTPESFGWSEEGDLFRGSVFLLALEPATGIYTSFQKLDPPGVPADRTGFGETVAFAHRADGFLTLFVGEGGGDSSGIHVFEYDPFTGRFLFEQTIATNHAGAFPQSIAAADGLVAVSALSEEDSQPGTAVVHILERHPSSGAWIHSARIEAGPVDPEHQAGIPVAAAQGEVIVGGWDDSASDPRQPSVKRFVREGDHWICAGKVETIESSWGVVESFGRTLHAFGSYLFVSGERGDGGGIGEAVVYQFRHTSAGWEELRVLAAASGPTGYAAGGRGFGTAVAADADFVWIGDPASSTDFFDASGMAYGFDLEPDETPWPDPYREFELKLAEAHPEAYSPGDDADGDVAANLLEFFLGMDPSVPEAPRNGRLFGGNNGEVFFQFPQRKNLGSVSFRVQVSSDLADWRDVTDPAFEPSIERDGHWMRTVFLGDECEPGKPFFARLAVLAPLNP